MPVFPDSRLTKFEIDFPFLLAPMVGLSHVGLRELVRSYLPPGLNVLTFTEMLSTRRLPDEKLASATSFLKIAKNEKFFIPQLLGNEEKYIKPSIDKLMQLNPWGIDINMGCPVSHTLKHNWGVRLMGDRNYAASVVSVTKKYSQVPVSVKLRGGAGDVIDLQELDVFTQALEDAGADWLTIHPRPRAAGHKGDANWEMVSLIKKRRKIPIVANGNIQNYKDAVSLLNDYFVDGAMIARAATARPWIFLQIAKHLGIFESQNVPCPMSAEEEGKEYVQSCLRYIQILKSYFDNDEFVLERLKFHTATASRWLDFGHAFWKLTTKAKTVDEAEQNIFEFGQKSQISMYEKVKIL